MPRTKLGLMEWIEKELNKDPKLRRITKKILKELKQEQKSSKEKTARKS